MYRIISFSFIAALPLLWGTFNLFGDAYKYIGVWQVPRDLHVPQGENANITCHFYVPVDFPRVTINWKKDHEHTSFKQMVVPLRNASNASNVLQLKSLHQNQSGLYTCEVRIETPKLWIGCGTGTNVSVTAGRPEGPTGLIPSRTTVAVPVWILVFAVTLLLIILGIFVMVFRRCKSDTQTSEDRAENTLQIIFQESSQNTDEITYASINKQMINIRENQQRPPKQESVRSQTQGQGVEESVLYSAIRTKHVD